MATPVDALKQMSIPPTEETSFNTWLQLGNLCTSLQPASYLNKLEA